MIALLLDRLTTHCANVFAAIEEPTRVSPLERDAYPVATVYLLDETPNGAHGGRYIVDRRYRILITAETGAQLETARHALGAALNRWMPTGAAGAFAFASGTLEAIDGPFLQWGDVWQIPIFLLPA